MVALQLAKKWCSEGTTTRKVETQKSINKVTPFQESEQNVDKNILASILLFLLTCRLPMLKVSAQLDLNKNLLTLPSCCRKYQVSGHEHPAIYEGSDRFCNFPAKI